MPRLVEIGQVVLERKILKFLQCIFGALHFLPLENGGALRLNNLEYLSPKDALSIVPSLVEIGPVVLVKKIFKFHQCILAISLLYPLGKRWGLFSLANLNPIHK